MSEKNRPELKVRILNSEHNKHVQEVLNKLGFKTPGKGAYYSPQALGNHSLYTWSDDDYFGYMPVNPEGNSNSEDFFNDDERIEYVLRGDELVPKDSFLYQLTREPVGLRPRVIAEAERSKEILEAMLRYIEGGKRIPVEWMHELYSLNVERPAT